MTPGRQTPTFESLAGTKATEGGTTPSVVRLTDEPPPLGDDPNAGMAMSAAEHYEQPNVLLAALRYADLGLRVVPIAPAGKNPILRDWPNRASNQPDEIREWWTRRPEAGVGLVTGLQPDGTRVIAVDVDNHNAASLGADTIADLERANSPLPDTWRQITGSGGQHILYRIPADIAVRNDAGKLLGPGVDIRSDGGQIVAAPTIHPNGRPYEWEDGYAPWETELADAPQWLIGHLTAQPDQPREPVAQPYDGPERPGDRWAAATPWQSLLEGDGAKYLATHRDGWEMWARPGIDGDHTSATLYHNGNNCLHVFTSNWPGLEQDKSYTKIGYLAATRFAGDHSAAARWIVDQGYGTRPDNGDGIIGDTLNTPPDADPAAPSRLRAVLIHGDDITRLPAVEWLIPNVLQANSLAAIYGPPKTFKSFLAVDLSLHLTNGVPWRNRPVDRPIRVLYVVAEGAPGVGPRASAWIAHHGGTMSGMSWIPIAPSLFRDTIESQEIADIACEYGCELVIIDTLARSIAGAEENSAKDLGIVVEHLDLIRTRSGATVLVVHHMGKNGAQGMRGSSALHGAIDTGLEVKGDASGIRMTVADQKNAEGGIDWWWKPVSTGLSVVLDPLSGPPEENDVMALNCLRQLYELGGEATNGDWQTRCNAMLGVGRKMYEKYRADLLAGGLVEFESKQKGAATTTRWAATQAGVSAITDID